MEKFDDKTGMTAILERENLNSIREQIKKSRTSNIELDFSKMEVLEASKAAVISSAMLYKKYPESKIKCHLKSDGIVNSVSSVVCSSQEAFPTMA